MKLPLYKYLLINKVVYVCVYKKLFPMIFSQQLSGDKKMRKYLTFVCSLFWMGTKTILHMQKINTLMNIHVIAIFPCLQHFLIFCIHWIFCLADDICFGNQKNNCLNYRLDNVGLLTKAYAFFVFFFCVIYAFSSHVKAVHFQQKWWAWDTTIYIFFFSKYYRLLCVFQHL